MQTTINDTVVVSDVFEVHNCSGTKHIYVTIEGDCNNPRSTFMMTRSYMGIYDKLNLATVSPGDRIKIVLDDTIFNGTCCGYYVEIVSRNDGRFPLCRCGKPMTSDGFDVYCSDPDCGLTVQARLERLSTIQFDCPYMLEYGERQATPFGEIINPKFWGSTLKSIDQILIMKKYGEISIATFLVENLFISLLDQIGTSDRFIKFSDQKFHLINQFYGNMAELIGRRNYESPFQNKLMNDFIRALGIESLKDDVICRLVDYEITLGWTTDVIIPYASLLSNPYEMSKEINIPLVESMAISKEFRSRKYEMFDIFSSYADPVSLSDIFSNSKLE